MTGASEGVHSPGAYSDGDHPEVAISLSAGGDVVRLTDFGSTLQRLRLSDLAPGMPRFESAMRATALGFGLYLEDGELRCEGTVNEVGGLLLAMSAAMLQLDALAVLRTEPRRPRVDTQLSTWLTERFPGKVEKRAKVSGRTGKRWSVTAEVTVVPGEPVYVQAVSRADGDVNSVNHAFRMFSELANTRASSSCWRMTHRRTTHPTFGHERAWPQSAVGRSATVCSPTSVPRGRPRVAACTSTPEPLDL